MRLSSTSLFAGLALCAGASAQSFNYTDFTSISGINLVGLAQHAAPILRIQDNVAPGSGGNNRGAAWYAQPVNVAGGFHCIFHYRMHTPSTTGGSDGMAFVIQNDLVAGVPMTEGFPDGIGNLAIGRHASAAGFGLFTTSLAGESIDNSLAIHLDTYNNGSGWGDSDANHVSIHTGGTGDNSQHENFSIGRAQAPFNLNDGLSHEVHVHYVPGTLTVSLDGTQLLQVAYDFLTGGTWGASGQPVGGLDLINGTMAFVGFTSGAGSAREYRDIESWEFMSMGGPSDSLYCSPAANNSTGGSVTLAASDFSGPGVYHLEASGGPLNQFGMFVVSASAVDPGVAISQGFLCLGAPLGRYSSNAGAGLNSIGKFDATGILQNLVGTSSVGTGFDVPASLPNPPGGSISTGSTWNFQLWYRDGVNSNFSDAMAVSF